MSLEGRVWKTSEDGKIEWMTLGEAHMEGAMTVMRESFLKNESISIVTCLAQRPEAGRQMERLFTIIAREDRSSIVAVQKATGKVVGVALNKISKKGGISFLEKMKQEPGIDAGYAELINFVSKVETKVDVFQHYNIDSVLDHMFLATHPDWYRQGIGLGLVSASVKLAKALQSVHAVIGIFTVPASQKIGKRLGWDELADVSYESLSYEGEKYSDRLGPGNPNSLFMGIKL